MDTRRLKYNKYLECGWKSLVFWRNNCWMETGDRVGSWWISISHDRLENTQSLGHLYSYPRSAYVIGQSFTQAQRVPSLKSKSWINGRFLQILLDNISFLKWSCLVKSQLEHKHSKCSHFWWQMYLQIQLWWHLKNKNTYFHKGY